MKNPIKTIKEAVKIVFSSRFYFLVAGVSFFVFFTLYSFLLPATYTGGRIGLISLRLLNLKLGVFAFLFSFALSLIIPFYIYIFKKSRKAYQSSLVAGGFIASILPPFLCCSPLLANIAVFLGGFLPFVIPGIRFFQGIVATYETEFLVAIAILLFSSLYFNAKGVISAKNKQCFC